MDKPRLINMVFYGLCGLTSILSAWPDYNVINAGLTLTALVLVAAYIVRLRAIPDSLVHHHMTYVIRTLWIYSTLALIGLLFASYWIFEHSDRSAIDALIDGASSGVMPGEEEIRAIEESYLAANEPFIIETLIASLFPGLLYLVWRVSRGASRARRNFRVQNLYSWI